MDKLVEQSSSRSQERHIKITRKSTFTNRKGDKERKALKVFRVDFRVFLFSLFISLLTPSLAFAARPPEDFDAYGLVPNTKSLLTSPQFLLIDDFNTGKLKSHRGTFWQTKTPAAGALDLELIKKDARNPQRGYSLKAKFHLVAKEKASFKLLLNRVDVSKAEYLVFKCRINVEGKDKFPGRLRLAITDWRYRTALRDITATCPVNSEEWGDVVIPLSTFRRLDLDQVFALEFRLVTRDKKQRGDLFLDEVAFFGFNDVSFESNRDNLVGFPRVKLKPRRRENLKHFNDETLLKAIAYDTWKYFKSARDKDTHLIVDHIRLGDAPLAADYTSPTNIAMDILAIISAMDFGFIKRKEAVDRLKKIMDTLSDLRRYKGFFYNFYDTKKLKITRSYISTVDSGWLAIAFVVLRQAFPAEFRQKTTRFLSHSNFDELLDPENNHFVIGLEVPERSFGLYHYGMLVSEARATSFYAIGKGDVPSTHWWFLYRTPPGAWKWQNQEPKGDYVERDGVGYIQGYYEYKGRKFVPSWGGSLFEYLMPTLVMKEKALAEDGLGLNNKVVTEMHRDYALKEKKYPVWGISPAATTNGKRWEYNEYGVKTLAVKGYPDRSVITPHVSFLALDSLPEDAIKNIRKLLDYDMYGAYGFYDSINLRNEKVNYQYLALDQGMTLVALCNYLNKGSIQERFHADTIAKAAEELLEKENFLIHN